MARLPWPPADQVAHAGGPDVLDMRAARLHRELLARAVGARLAADRQRDVALEHQREHVEWMRVLRVVAIGLVAVGADLGVTVGLQASLESSRVDGHFNLISCFAFPK